MGPLLNQFEVWQVSFSSATDETVGPCLLPLVTFLVVFAVRRDVALVLVVAVPRDPVLRGCARVGRSSPGSQPIGRFALDGFAPQVHGLLRRRPVRPYPASNACTGSYEYPLRDKSPLFELFRTLRVRGRVGRVTS